MQNLPLIIATDPAAAIIRWGGPKKRTVIDLNIKLFPWHSCRRRRRRRRRDQRLAIIATIIIYVNVHDVTGKVRRYRGSFYLAGEFSSPSLLAKTCIDTSTKLALISHGQAVDRIWSDVERSDMELVSEKFNAQLQ